MFVHPRAKAVEAFTPPALPGFIAIPASIPFQSAFDALRFTVARHTWRRSGLAKTVSGPPGSFTITVCCSMLSATPEWKSSARH
ncbi:MAG TPA: hypothetical protein VJ023_02605 [Pyrinomonadaceae bacterium]|nr:hypothetical protein [Pyrinomonadaceae bacterium]